MNGEKGDMSVSREEEGDTGEGEIVLQAMIAHSPRLLLSLSPPLRKSPLRRQ